MAGMPGRYAAHLDGGSGRARLAAVPGGSETCGGEAAPEKVVMMQGTAAIATGVLVALAGVGFGVLRARASAGAAREIERLRAELEKGRERPAKRGDSDRRRDEELAELRRRLEKTKRRASQARDEGRQESSRIRDLEEKLRLAQADARSMHAELQRAEGEVERLRAAPRPAPAPVAAPPPVREPAPMPDEALVRRVEAAEARALALEEQLLLARVDGERQRRRIAAQDRLYVAIRGELDAKKERLRAQQEELERLRALRVVLAADAAQSPDPAGDPARRLPGVDDESEERDPQVILEFWFDRACDDPARAAARESFWFGASSEVDAQIRGQFLSAVEAAARGALDSWTDAPRAALALVVLLDQFPRNIWRGTAGAFAHDARALQVARESIARGHLSSLAPLERAFLVLPFQHSEAIEDQREAVRLSSELVQAAPAEWKPALERHLEFAKQHLALIERFGRFPHRNRALGRASTPEEEAYLGGGGATFGQGAR